MTIRSVTDEVAALTASRAIDDLMDNPFCTLQENVFLNHNFTGRSFPLHQDVIDYLTEHPETSMRSEVDGSDFSWMIESPGIFARYIPEGMSVISPENFIAFWQQSNEDGGDNLCSYSQGGTSFTIVTESYLNHASETWVPYRTLGLMELQISMLGHRDLIDLRAVSTQEFVFALRRSPLLEGRYRSSSGTKLAVREDTNTFRNSAQADSALAWSFCDGIGTNAAWHELAQTHDFDAVYPYVIAGFTDPIAMSNYINSGIDPTLAGSLAGMRA